MKKKNKLFPDISIVQIGSNSLVSMNARRATSNSDFEMKEFLCIKITNISTKNKPIDHSLQD